MQLNNFNILFLCIKVYIYIYKLLEYTVKSRKVSKKFADESLSFANTNFVHVSNILLMHFFLNCEGCVHVHMCTCGSACVHVHVGLHVHVCMHACLCVRALWWIKL